MPLPIMAGLQAAGTIAGIFGAANQADIAQQQHEDAMRRQDAALQAQMRQASFAASMGNYALDLNRQQDDYYRGVYQDQNAAEQELQRYLRAGDMENAQRVAEEIQNIRARQAQADNAAREMRMFELERIASDDQISQYERQYAIQELQRERQIARQEREQEISRIGNAQGVLDTEYGDRVRRLNENRTQAMSERQREIQQQDQVTNSIMNTRGNLRQLLDQYGTTTAPELFGADEIDRRAAVNSEGLMKVLNKNIAQTQSVTEAELMGRGLGTAGGANNQIRSEVLARMIPEIQAAQLTAQTSAAGEVEARNKTILDRFNLGQDTIRGNLDREMAVGMSGIDQLLSRRAAPSAIYDQDVGSSIDPQLLRILGSEQNVRGPLDIESLVRSISGPSSGVADYMRPDQLTANRSGNAGYAQAPRLNTYDYSSMFGNASNGYASVASAYGTRGTDAGTRAGTAAGYLGTALGDFMTEGFGENGFFSDIGDWWNSRGAPPSGSFRGISPGASPDFGGPAPSLPAFGSNNSNWYDLIMGGG